jgi:hypothetical protein
MIHDDYEEITRMNDYKEIGTCSSATINTIYTKNTYSNYIFVN